jgi:hypothetical protein
MRTALFSICLAASLAAVVGVAQAGETPARATVETTIFQDDLHGFGHHKFRFFGHIESSGDECLPDRTVTMKKRDHGKWVLADKTKTDNEGAYATTAHLPGEPPLKFTVKTREIGPTTCASDSIKPFGGKRAR